MAIDPRRDVHVVLKLYEMYTRPDAQEARVWMYTEFQARDYAEFLRKYPPGSRDWRRFTLTCGMYELFGVLVKYEMIDPDLFFDLFGGIQLLWEKVAPVVPGMREEISPHLYVNFERLVEKWREWDARQRAE